VLIDDAKSATNAGRSWLTNAAMGAAIGLVFSCLAVIAIGVRRDKVFTREQLGYVAKRSAGGEWKEESWRRG
jgi:hypothetical protein